MAMAAPEAGVDWICCNQLLYIRRDEADDIVERV
jgi:hypothetical protein